MDNIRLQIQKGHVEEAIEAILPKAKHTIYENELITLSSRNHTNQRNQRLGIISSQDYNLTNNRITYELLTLIDKLEQKIDNQGTTQQVIKSQSRKILFCESNPLQQNLFSNIELREVEDLINKRETSLELISKFGLSLERFVDLINQNRPEVIHLTAFSNDLGIYFHDKSDGPVQIPNALFLTYFEVAKNQVECIFFNTFISRDLAKDLSTSQVFVIGYNDVIDSYGAIEFATGFYTALNFGKGYEAAFNIGYQSLVNGKYKDNTSKLFAYFEGKQIAI